MLTAAVLLAALATPAAPATAPPAAAAPETPFGPAWTAIAGDWTGEGGGSPGAGSGSSSFRFELGGHVLVRRSTSDYPAAGGRPAVHHEDLLVFSPSAARGEADAVYFDNEGHVIRYAAAWSADGKVLTLVGGGAAAGPRYRLTYTFLSPDRVSLSFEVAPPGSPEYRRHVGGVLVRETAR